MTNIFLKLFKAITRSYSKKYSFVGKDYTKSFKLRDMDEIKRKSKSPPGVVTLHVLGCGADGAPASVYLFTDQSRYLFNCGEGTQRLAHEYKTKLSRLEHIFFTDKCWSKIGGLPGLALTAQDAGVTQLTLHGPPQLNTLFQAMNRFVVLKKINIETNSFTANDIFEDDVMIVRVLKILSHTAQKKDILETGTSNAVFLYVCKLKPKPGALDLKKCVDKGVPPGPQLGLLKAGIDITLNDGTVVKSSEVSEPTTENQTLIFVDIPNVDYLYSLNNEFTQYDNVAIVIHFSSEKIVSSGFYQLFLSKFGKSTQHMFLNTSNSFSGYVAAHRIQIQLNQLHEGIFPHLGEAEKNDETNTHKRTRFTWNPDIDKDYTNELSTSQIISRIRSMTSFRLRPYTGLDRAMELAYTPDEYLKETHALEGFTKALCDLKLMFMGKKVKKNNIFPKIIFLGTGSCIPNKTRNVSAILLQLNEEAFILLDCGEGTLGQIVRFFGPLRWQNVIKKLKAIYISHLHADHHIGLIGVLEERKRLLGKEEQPLFLFAPKQILPWLNYYIEMIEPLDHSYVFIPNGDMVNTPYKSTSLTNIGIRNISTCLVKHCPHSFGVAIVLNTTDDTSEPLKLTYSGDTMPCPDLINLGYNSTVLIHEATMEDELSDEAAIKMHCTISQALDVAQKMNAKYTVLTHFSQRYAKLPRFPHKLLSNIAIAFDFMQVSIEDLRDFSLMYPAMKLMFSEHYEEMERKTEMRLKKSERKRK